MHSFHDAQAGRITHREKVVILQRHRTRKGENLLVELKVQPCDVCGSIESPFYWFAINGEAFCFCSKHKDIGVRHHGEVAQESDQPTLF